MLELVEFVAHRLEGNAQIIVVEVKASGGDAALNLAGMKQARQVLGHLTEDPRLAAGL